MKLRIAATLLAVGLLAACTDDPEPKVEPSESPTRPTTTSPTRPPEELQPTGVVRAWIDAQNEALISGDTAELRRISDPSCTTCLSGFVDPIEDVYAAGGHFETDGWRVTAAQSRESSSPTIEVDVGVEISGGRTYADSEAEPVSYETETRILLFKVRDQAVTFVGFVS